MNSRNTNKKRRLAYVQGLLPDEYASKCTESDGRVLVTHEVELSTLEKTVQGEHNAQHTLYVEALAKKRFSRGCAFDDGAVEDCSG